MAPREDLLEAAVIGPARSVDGLPHRVLDRLDDVIEPYGGDIVIDSGLDDRGGDDRGRGPQVGDRREQQRPGLGRVDLAGDRVGGGYQHVGRHVLGSGDDRAQGEAGVEQRVVGLADLVVDPL